MDGNGDARMKKLRESKVESGIKAAARELGVTMQKQNGPGDRGKTDQLCMKNGIAGFLEIKRPGEVPTKLQLRYIYQRQEDGFPATWVDSIEAGVKWLKETFS